MELSIEQKRAMALAAARLRQKTPPVAQLTGAVAPQGSSGQPSENIEDRRPTPEPARPDLMNSTVATVNGLVNGIPIIGPMAQDITDNVGGMIDQALGGDRQGYIDRQKRIREEAAAAAPLARLAGELGGSIGGVGAAAKVPAVAEALGVTGAKLLPRVANSTLSGAAISGADAAVRGGDPIEAALIGGGISGAVPLVGAGLGAITRAVGSKVAPTVNAALRPDEEAARRAGLAFDRDLSSNPNAWGGADDIAARDAGLPVINADRGGETVRALTRSVANQSPEARAVIDKTASDRFAGQGPRAVETVKRIAGGSVDDLGYQAAIKDAARAANKPAYNRAFAAPNARAVWNDPIRELMQSDTFRKAINAAESRGTDRAAISGFKAVRDPFTYGPNGQIGLKKMPDGSTALPSLQFWDQVKRNLDGMIGAAQRTGDNTVVSDLTQMKQKLVGALDQAVPDYQKARAGAAAFFDAEDALEAGKKFANNNRMVPEARQAFNNFSTPEKAAFRTGYASSLIDKIMSAGDRTNVINQMFKSPAAREMIELVFGAAKAKELEAYVRVETLADMLRGALGNSTTARQLVELGIGGGTGFALTGDWKGALAGAALTSGTRAVGQRIDNGVMKSIAKLLTSDNPNAVNAAVQQALKSPRYMQALERMALALAPPARAGAVAVGSAQSQQN